MGPPVIGVVAIGKFLNQTLLAVSQSFFSHVVERYGDDGEFWWVCYRMAGVEHVSSRNEINIFLTGLVDSEMFEG